MKKLETIVSSALMALPILALAQAPGFVQPTGTGIEQIIKIIDRISLWLLYGLLTLAVVFIVYAAYLYLTAAGDPEKVKSASNVIIYAVVSIGVALLSRVIVAIAKALVQPGA